MHSVSAALILNPLYTNAPTPQNPPQPLLTAGLGEWGGCPRRRGATHAYCQGRWRGVCDRCGSCGWKGGSLHPQRRHCGSASVQPGKPACAQVGARACTLGACICPRCWHHLPCWSGSFLWAATALSADSRSHRRLAYGKCRGRSRLFATQMPLHSPLQVGPAAAPALGDWRHGQVGGAAGRPSGPCHQPQLPALHAFAFKVFCPHTPHPSTLPHSPPSPAWLGAGASGDGAPRAERLCFGGDFSRGGGGLFSAHCRGVLCC